MPTSKDSKKLDDITAVKNAISLMPDHDRIIGERLHEIIMAAAPELMPRTWYGMPAYSNGSKLVCWFRSGKKFGERYMTLGFNDGAKLDTGDMWPISFAVKEISPTVRAEIIELIKRAIS